MRLAARLACIGAPLTVTFLSSVPGSHPCEILMLAPLSCRISRMAEPPLPIRFPISGAGTSCSRVSIASVCAMAPILPRPPMLPIPPAPMGSVACVICGGAQLPLTALYPHGAHPWPAKKPYAGGGLSGTPHAPPQPCCRTCCCCCGEPRCAVALTN